MPWLVRMAGFGFILLALGILLLLLLLLWSRRRPRRVQPSGVAWLDPESCRIERVEGGLWRATLFLPDGTSSVWTGSHPIGQPMREFEPGWFDQRGRRATDAFEEWLDRRRSEYIHQVDREAAEHRTRTSNPTRISGRHERGG